MEENEIKQTWQYSELKSYFESHSHEKDIDSKNVYLSNPKEREAIDKILRDYMWPGVLKGIGTSGIWVKALEGTFPQSGIEDENAVYTTRSLTFLLEDPKRQISYESNVPWYCRVKIQCSVFDFMVSFDFYIYFPEDFSLRKITRLLKNSSFEGLPPELSYSRSMNGEGIFCLAFSKGTGAGWGLHGHDSASDIIRDEIRLIIQAIRAVYKLEKDYKSTKAFNELESTLVECFGAT